MLVSMKEILNEALRGHYAIPHFNINNLEWTKYILEECEALRTPLVLGVSEGTIKYMGGVNTVVGIVNGLINDLNITIPVCLHLDHGSSFEACKECIDAGFSSVMIDASINSLDENIRITKEVVDYAHSRNVSVEAEIGHIGSMNDELLCASLDDCLKLYEETNIDALAPALGNVHGLYKGEPNLNFEQMKLISESLNIPLVLHGGSGIPDEKIKKAISFGICKINVNTDFQIAWSNAVREYLNNNGNISDPRKIISAGEQAIKNIVDEKVSLFGSLDKFTK